MDGFAHDAMISLILWKIVSNLILDLYDVLALKENQLINFTAL